MRKKMLCIIIASFLLSTSWAQEITSKQVDDLVKKSMQTFDVPGIAIAIIKDGKIIHSKGYGVRSLQSKAKVDENTLFGIASNSKAFTAFSLAILVDEGKLNWDDKVRDYIPEFKLYNSFVTEEFTIRDLLTHRSGLGLGAGDLMIFPDSNNFKMTDLIHNMRYLKATSSFRSKFDYDNLLYIFAGEIVTRASGMSWEDFVEKRIMKPLEMKQSAAFIHRLKNKENIALAHAPVEGKLQVVDSYDNPLMNPAGGIYATISDMSKWIIMQLNKGVYNKDTLVSEKEHQEMWSPQTILKTRKPGHYNTHFSAYGLGWFLKDVAGKKLVAHTGGLPGMVTQVTMIPELNLGIIVLTNQQSGAAFTAITNQILDSYLGLKGEDWVTKYGEKVEKRKEKANKIVDKVWEDIEIQQQKSKKNKPNEAPFLGNYTDNWFGEVEISKKGEKLFFSAKRSPKLTGELLFYKGNTFIVKWKDRSMDADAFVLFDKDFEGNVIGMKMKAISPLTDFSYDFQDLDFAKKRRK